MCLIYDYLGKDREEDVGIIPAGNYMFKVNNRNTRTLCNLLKCDTIGVVLVSYC